MVMPTGTIPAQYGLQEGDFIRAEGDNDIYIINNFGYKRLVLSPTICKQYAHLGRRGCFDVVHIVSMAMRDAFLTSPYYTNGETSDGIVYKLIINGEDSAVLAHTTWHLWDFSIDTFTANAVFRINTREQNSYTQAVLTN